MSTRRKFRATTTAVALLAGAGFLSAITAEAAPPAPAAVTQAPTAAAWVVDASLLSGHRLVQLAQVRASSGGAPSAWASPIALDGRGPDDVSASTEQPQASAAQIDWKDGTGSLTVQGGYGSANVEPTSTAARAGIGAVSGSSFTMASKLLTWDQQQQLTGAVAKLNDALIDPLNSALQGLAPVLSALGLTLPPIQKMSPLAVINVGSGETVTASASTAFSPGFSAAHARADVTSIQLFDGFISIDGVHVTAGSENASGTPTLTSTAALGQVSIAGLPVRIGDQGIEVLGNSVLARATLQPLLDRVLSLLTTLGVTLRFAETSTHGNTREATALELDVPTPAGVLALSVGHAEADAPPPPPVPSDDSSSGSKVEASGAAARPSTSSAAARSVPSSLPPTTGGELTPMADAGAVSTSAVPPAPADSGTGTYAEAAAIRGVPSWLGVALPANAAKALGNVFLLILLGGVALAMVPPMLFASGIRRQTVRPAPRRPILDREVAP